MVPMHCSLGQGDAHLSEADTTCQSGSVDRCLPLSSSLMSFLLCITALPCWLRCSRATMAAPVHNSTGHARHVARYGSPVWPCNQWALLYVVAHCSLWCCQLPMVRQQGQLTHCHAGHKARGLQASIVAEPVHRISSSSPHQESCCCPQRGRAWLHEPRHHKPCAIELSSFGQLQASACVTGACMIQNLVFES